MRRTSTGKAERHPLWTRERFMEDLRTYGQIKKVCEIYAQDGSYKPYQTDVWRWRQDDPEFDLQVSEILVSNGAKTEGGRKPLDAGDKSWRDEFCRVLVESNWSMQKAADATPYSLRAIQDMLDSTTTTYDEEFAKMVEAAELQISSRAREIIVGAGLDPNSYVDMDTAKITQTRVWVALKTQERLEKKFSSRKLEVSGTVDHRHQHRYLPPNEQLAMLISDRQRFMEARISSVPQLPPKPETEELPVLEAVVVEPV